MSSAGFKFGEDVGTPPRTIKGVMEVKTFLVGYTDNDGRESARIAFRLPGQKTTYILQERISGNQVVLPANEWFHKGFVDKLQAEGLEESTGEAVDSV